MRAACDTDLTLFDINFSSTNYETAHYAVYSSILSPPPTMRPLQPCHVV
jgi:hypothetical protein